MRSIFFQSFTAETMSEQSFRRPDNYRDPPRKLCFSRSLREYLFNHERNGEKKQRLLFVLLSFLGLRGKKGKGAKRKQEKRSKKESTPFLLLFPFMLLALSHSSTSKTPHYPWFLSCSLIKD